MNSYVLQFTMFIHFLFDPSCGSLSVPIAKTLNNLPYDTFPQRSDLGFHENMRWLVVETSISQDLVKLKFPKFWCENSQKKSKHLADLVYDRCPPTWQTVITCSPEKTVFFTLSICESDVLETTRRRRFRTRNYNRKLY